MVSELIPCPQCDQSIYPKARICEHCGVNVALAALLIGYSAGLLSLVHLLQPVRLGLRVVSGLLLMAPLAFLMGLPFPMGLRLLADMDSERTAWAWAAPGASNGPSRQKPSMQVGFAGIGARRRGYTRSPRSDGGEPAARIIP